MDQAFLNRELWRRQQGYGRGGRMKIETDKAHILVGVRHGKTIGSPIAILLENNDWKNWTEALPVEDRRSGKAQAGGLAAARPRRPCRRTEVQFSRCALRAGAGFCARIGGARGRRGDRQACCCANSASKCSAT